MTNSQRLATVRTHLLRWLAENASETHANSVAPTEQGDSELGTPNSAAASKAAIVSESILIRGEMYCGRSFVGQNHKAVWFIEEDELKIRASDGTVVAVFRGEEIGSDSRNASAESNDEDAATELGPAVIKMNAAQTENAQTPNGSDDNEQDVRRAA